jgi:hypothetical protein
MIKTTGPFAFLIVVLPLLAAACGFGRSPIGLELRESGRFDSEWRRYLQFPPHKSLAFAGDVEGRYVIGYGLRCTGRLRDPVRRQAYRDRMPDRRDRRRIHR